MIWKDKEVLHLVLMRDPFERIMNGTKPIEYRDNTPYWTKRLKDKDIKDTYTFSTSITRILHTW